MDKNYRSHSDENDIKIIGENIEPSSGWRSSCSSQLFPWDDTLKFSHCENVNVSFCNIWGSREDVIDMNRECREMVVYGCNLYVRGLYGVTIKGGTRTVWFQNCIFSGEPQSGYDIDLGNWSDQSDKLTTDVGFEECRHSSGRPLRIRVLWADRPILVKTNAKVTRYPRFLVAIYRFFRRFLS